ncbi:MAG: DNA/RNA nuclease SfsA [Asgard group archaeon]|nr:DNA/RNA nuclease SfsA [Asgard group archaeon]
MSQKIVSIPGEVKEAIFNKRLNRFTVKLILEDNSKAELAYLHDPGRLKNLLKPKTNLLIRKPLSKKPRKTNWDILAVKERNQIVAINSSFPNMIFKQALQKKWFEIFSEFDTFDTEVSIGDSRLDFCLRGADNKDRYLEVKGVTLVEGNTAMFPDAPTTRGLKHLRELQQLHKANNHSGIVFIVMRNDPTKFSPNYSIDPEFSRELHKAISEGIETFIFKMRPYCQNKQLHLAYESQLKLELNEAFNPISNNQKMKP